MLTINDIKSTRVIWQPVKISSKNNSHLPLVSFIIPTLNSEKTLEKCLRSITEQDYPSIEIIIVDGGSKDNTINIAMKYNAKVLEFRGNLGAARQLGISKASGELIANWDSDIYIPHKGWLRRAIQILLSYPNASTLWIYNISPPNSTLVAKAFSWYSWKIMLNFARRRRGFWGGGNSIFRKYMVMNVKGFNSKIDTGEDFDLAKKLSLKGHSIIFYKDFVYHDTFRSLSELIRKDLRRAINFHKIGISNAIGIPVHELLLEHIKIILLSIKNLFRKKKVFLVLVPIIILLRLTIYLILYFCHE
ncbi:MAG: glycosyltransferase [Promethearchaeota archaeon]